MMIVIIKRFGHKFQLQKLEKMMVIKNEVRIALCYPYQWADT